MRKVATLFCLAAAAWEAHGARIVRHTWPPAVSLSSRHTAAPTLSSRRAACAGLAAAALLGSSASASDEPPVKVYFGAGCFWHVQHEFVKHEAVTLSRGGDQISAVSGYAGGTKLGSGDRVCYHNMQQLADYGKLGHAEVVQLSIPPNSLDSFAKKYVSLFGENGIRHDPQDRGGEYRSLVGLPGGTASPLYASMQRAAAGTPMRLVPGTGDEEDTLGARTILVMDSTKFPFYPAELYHQFHNDFQGPPYGKAYNNLLTVQFNSGRVGPTGCPDLQLS